MPYRVCTHRIIRTEIVDIGKLVYWIDLVWSVPSITIGNVNVRLNVTIVR